MHIPHYNVVSHPVLSVIFRGFSELFALEKTIGRISELSRSFKGSYTKKTRTDICSNHGLNKLFSERQLFNLVLVQQQLQQY